MAASTSAALVVALQVIELTCLSDPTSRSYLTSLAAAQANTLHAGAHEVVRWPAAPHRWSVTPKQAIAIQRTLARQVSHTPPKSVIHTLAGLDAAFTRDGRCVGGVALWDLRARRILEERVAVRAVSFPYVPGLLSFREAPVLLAALRKLRRRPDALLCDGQGLAHPRRFGLACHIGVICALPTVGCAKSRLIGVYREPGMRRGSRTRLQDGSDIIGTVLRTSTNVKPLFVSIGNQIDLEGAVRLVLHSAFRFRVPEPIRCADRLVARAKQELLQQNSARDRTP